MRMLLKVSLDNQVGSSAVVDGTLAKVMGSTLERLDPEAAYFTAENGKRTAFIFFDLADNTDIPSIAEPLFRLLGADITFSPAMDAEDLQQALTKLVV